MTEQMRQHPRTSLETYNNYMENWEGHRNEAEYHMEYFAKSFLLFMIPFINTMPQY